MIAIEVARTPGAFGLSFGLALIVAGTLLAVALSRLGYWRRDFETRLIASVAVFAVVAAGAGAGALTGMEMREAREVRVAQIAGGWGLSVKEASLLERRTAQATRVTLGPGVARDCVMVTRHGLAELHAVSGEACGGD